ncbi:dimethyladenosine transferase 1, mitochondrial-like [Ctenocephalides felis]|uniref:dimethyladenosine transferase 1, mitochondrial-like n=1 Tax=Ctenocephalides felis TaxID=7515 RepID=UPI000E6E1495|nr:dimethyladenosine transferase 1, mitochondrial-like [Ctenocephalides felis]
MIAQQLACKLRLPPLPTIRDLVKLYKLRALKQMSQNFLMDERLTDKIVRAAGNIEGHYVCEVGPGPGGITRSIIRKGPQHLVVVEKDKRFMPTLQLLAEACHNSSRMDIVIDDILKYQLAEAFPGVPSCDWMSHSPPINIIGNLPFSISTILLIQWLEAISRRESIWQNGRATMTLTFQKEVAERIVAPIMSNQRCRLSVICQIYCDVKHKFTIPGSAFVPKPQVDVGVVHITPWKTPKTDVPFKVVEKVLRNIFNMRQKYFVRGLETLFPEEKRETLTQQVLLLADMDPTIRPFQISNEEFVRIINAYNALALDHPDILSFDHRACKKLNSDVQV